MVFVRIEQFGTKSVLSVFSVAYPCSFIGFYIFFQRTRYGPIHVDVGIGSADAVCDSGNQKPPRLFVLACEATA